MKRTILPFCISFVAVFTAFFTSKSQAQTLSHGEELEKIFSFWSLTMEQTRVEVGATKQEFGIFNRFCRHPIDSVYIEFTHKIDDNSVGVNNVKDYMASKRSFFVELFRNFREIERDYPSSVDEYKTEPRPRIGGDSCFSNCYNTGFEDGTFDGWYGYYAENFSTATAFDYTNTTGGYLGPVTEAASDPYTLNHNQLRITSGSATDWFLSTYSTYSMPQVSPWGGSHSVLMGDTTYPDRGMAILSQSFYVSPTTASLTYQYSVFLENPASHTYFEQPIFWATVLDQNGDTIPLCGAYTVNSDSARHDNFTAIYYPYEADTVYWKPWTIVNVPLKHYIGQCVTIIFQVQDCSLSGHFGYAYVDASCSPLQLITSSPNFCGQDSISLTAPPGATYYAWIHGIGDTILTDTNKQTVWVKDSGTYTVITTPVTGAACADTISIHVGKLPGPPPTPSFTADTVCAGVPTQFINTSDSTHGIFSWDFYNLGIYNYIDTNNFNPTWTYVNPGIYVVKMNEILSNGCGATVYDTIIVDTNVTNPTFTASPTCLGDTTYFTPTASGASKYDWNFGDPSSHSHDSSKLEIPGHLYTSAGTYEVHLFANNKGGCGAVDSMAVTIYAVPVPVITGDTLICAGSNDTLRAFGGTTYSWSTGSTRSAIIVNPTSATTYTLEAYNGTCSKDTTFKVDVVPAPTPTATVTKDSVCKGDTLTIFGHGGTTYKWTTGSTTHVITTDSTIHVTINSDTTFKLFEYGGTCIDSISVSLKVIPKITASKTIEYDSVCPGKPDILTATGIGGASTYKWYPSGATTPSITINPLVSFTYTATVYGICDSVQELYPITVVPVPVPKITGSTWKCKGVKDTLFVTSTTSPTTYLWSNGKTTTSVVTGDVTADTTWSVTATNALGCDTTITFTIQLRNAPTVSVNPNTIACSGAQIALIATAVGSNSPFTFTWSNGTSSTSTGRDTIYVSPTTVTTYTVTASNGCVSRVASTTVTPNSPSLYACCNKTILIGEDTTIVAFGDSMKSYSWSPDSGLVCLNPPVCDSVQVTPTITTTYTVTGTDSLGCQVSRLVTITIEIPCLNLNIPNVITPDNPGPFGLNNIFYIKTENVDAWSLTIYDRWGKEMYSSTDPNQFWAGTNKSGAEASDGVYYYIITGTCQKVTYKKEGFVQLIR